MHFNSAVGHTTCMPPNYMGAFSTAPPVAIPLHPPQYIPPAAASAFTDLLAYVEQQRMIIQWQQGELKRVQACWQTQRVQVEAAAVPTPQASASYASPPAADELRAPGKRPFEEVMSPLSAFLLEEIDLSPPALSPPRRELSPPSTVRKRLRF